MNEGVIEEFSSPYFYIKKNLLNKFRRFKIFNDFSCKVGRKCSR